MDLIGWVIGLAAFAAAIYGIADARRERSKRGKAVVVVNRLVARLDGLLVGFKTSLVDRPESMAAANDGLEAIKMARDDLDRI